MQTGICTATTNGAPGILDFTPNGPKLNFVMFNGVNELRFIDVATSGGIAAETVGSCRKL